MRVGKDVREIVGTLRADKCTYFTGQSGGFSNNMCQGCSGLVKTGSFRDAFHFCNGQRRGGHSAPVHVDAYSKDTNNTKLTKDRLVHKASLIAKELNEATIKLRRMEDERDNWRRQVLELTGKGEAEVDQAAVLRQLAAQLTALSPSIGSPQEICAGLLSFHAGNGFEAAEGAKAAHDTFLAVLSDAVYNLEKLPQGRRYSEATKNFYAALDVRFGPAAAQFVALNVGGPGRTTIKKRIPKYTYRVGMQGMETTVKDTVLMYKRLMTLHGITPGTVHVKLAEDETATLSEFHWNEANDTLEGSCGLKTEHVGKKHQCRDDCVIDIKAGGRAGYDAIVDAFGQYQKGDYGRLIMYNPCHPKLPPMAIMVVPTCNRFDKEYVDRQWAAALQICNTHLGHVVGMVCGNDSDGDSRRRSLQQEAMLSKEGTRYFPPDCDGFTYTGRLTTVGEEIYDDQDAADGHYRDDEHAVADRCCPGLHPLTAQQATAPALGLHPLTEKKLDGLAYYHCDVCQKCLNSGPDVHARPAWHSCRACNYDICADCQDEEDAESEAQWAEAGAQEAADKVRRCFIPIRNLLLIRYSCACRRRRCLRRTTRTYGRTPPWRMRVERPATTRQG